MSGRPQRVQFQYSQLGDNVKKGAEAMTGTSRLGGLALILMMAINLQLAAGPERDALAQDASKESGGSQNAGSDSGGKGGSGGKGAGNQTGTENGKTKGAQQTKDSSGQSGQGGGVVPIETQMLTYGALEEVSEAITRRVCDRITDSGATVIVYDSHTFSSLLAYESFESNLTLFKGAYGAFKNNPTQEAASPLDIASLVAQFANASTTDNSFASTIDDGSVAISVAGRILNKCGSKLTVAYPAISIPASIAQLNTNDPMNDLQFILNRKALASASIKSKNDTASSDYKEINDLFDGFVKDLLSRDANTGVPGISSVIQGYKLSLLLKQPKAYILYLKTTAAGGTQRIRKNLFTNLITGDLIRYSGGIVVSYATIDAKSLLVMDAAILRYAQPSTTLKAPKSSNEVRRGTNF